MYSPQPRSISSGAVMRLHRRILEKQGRYMNIIPRRKLRYIIRLCGLDICNDPKRCEGMLRDLCPAYKREIHVLLSALRENVAADLIALSGVTPRSVLVEKLVERLYENLGIAREFGRWAVEAWSDALKDAPVIPPVQNEHMERFPASGIRHLKLRTRPLKVSDKDAPRIFNLNERWRPRKYLVNEFLCNGGDKIKDRVAQLVWQLSGSGYQTWSQAQEYIRSLNAMNFAGYNDWRLPSVEELVSVLEPEKQANGLYISPLFDPEQAWCWSADLRDSGGAWSVDFSTGEVRWNFIACNIRAVRSCLLYL